MIVFETQIKKFLKITESIKVSANAQCLYFQLLNLFNNKFYPNQLKISNIDLHNATHLSRQQLINARKELISMSLLDYISPSGSASGTYTIIDISATKIDSVISISKQNKPVINNLTDLNNQLDYLSGDNKLWADFIIQTLQKAITENKQGIYNNYYTTGQEFLKAKTELQIDVLFKLIMILKNKPDISNKQAYVLATLSNFVRDKQYKK